MCVLAGPADRSNPAMFFSIYCLTSYLLRVIHSILELFARCTTAIRNCCSVFSASCRARKLGVDVALDTYSRRLPDDRLLIQINPSVLLLHSVHRSARRRKIDQSWSTYTLFSKVQNVDIGRDHQREAAGQRDAGARRCAAREADRPAQRAGGD